MVDNGSCDCELPASSIRGWKELQNQDGRSGRSATRDDNDKRTKWKIRTFQMMVRPKEFGMTFCIRSVKYGGYKKPKSPLTGI